MHAHTKELFSPYVNNKENTVTMKNTEVTLNQYTLKTYHNLLPSATYLFLLLKQ
jgi:hypothetical protein